MLFGPDLGFSDDDDGFSDDNDFENFQQKVFKNRQNTQQQVQISEAEQQQLKLQAIFNDIYFGKSAEVVAELNNGLNLNVDLQAGWTPLLIAAVVGNEPVVAELLKRGADVNYTRDETTALMLACEGTDNSDVENATKNTLAVVKLLIENGINVNAVDRKRRTALMIAAHSGNLDIVKLLLPLSNKNAEDNQRWTALFWAVEGNAIEVVRFFLEQGFRTDKIDIRQNSVIDIAQDNGFDEIVSVIPVEDNHKSCYLHLSASTKFEENFRDLQKNQKPRFEGDICRILYGARSENVMPLLLERQLNLSEFLAVTDSELRELKIQLPYQRNRIMSALYRFHKQPFHPKSLPVIPKNDICSNIDMASVILTCIKQLTAMEGALNFILKNCDGNFPQTNPKESTALINRISKEIATLKLITCHLVQEAEDWDSALKPADLITKKRMNIPYGKLVLGTSIAAAIAIIVFKMR